MRPPVHPDLALLLLPLNVGVQLDRRLRRAIDVGGDAQIADAAESIRGGMRLALMLWQRQERRHPAVGAQPRRIVDRQPGVVTDLGTGHALDLVFVEDRRPHAAQVDLRRRRTHAEDDEQRRDDDDTDWGGLHGREYYYRRPTCERLYGRFAMGRTLARPALNPIEGTQLSAWNSSLSFNTARSWTGSGRAGRCWDIRPSSSCIRSDWPPSPASMAPSICGCWASPPRIPLAPLTRFFPFIWAAFGVTAAVGPHAAHCRRRDQAEEPGLLH